MKLPKIRFEPRDLFIGVYWDVKSNPLDTVHTKRVGRYPYVIYPSTLYVYILIIPMFPICFEFPLFDENLREELEKE